MALKTGISWATSTWNPFRGTKGNWTCIRVSEACRYCYAASQNERFSGLDFGEVGAAVPPDEPRLDRKTLLLPLTSPTWRDREGARVFVHSMTDTFGDWVPLDWIDQLFAVMAMSPKTIWLVLTKRPERMLEYIGAPSVHWPILDQMREIAAELKKPWLAHAWPGWPLPNVWAGTSVENNSTVHRAATLLQVPARVRFVSAEPLLGPVNMLVPMLKPGLIDWVITGGESGGPAFPTDHRKERRLVAPCDGPRATRIDRHPPECVDCHGTGWKPRERALTWVRTIRDAATWEGAAFSHKQWGGPKSYSAGRLLDGVEWEQWPDGKGGIVRAPEPEGMPLYMEVLL